MTIINAIIMPYHHYHGRVIIVVIIIIILTIKITILGTASLICSACKSSALLAGYAEKDDTTVAAEEYGFHLGMAYQIVDDILDFTGASATLGKPAQADMALGLSTACILYASLEKKELRPLIQRKYSEKGHILLILFLMK